MALHIPRTPQEARHARYREERGEYQRISRGIYVDIKDDPDEIIRANPLFIAANLYPDFRLVGESAICRGANDTGEIFISARSKIRYRQLGPLSVIRKQEFASEFEQVSIPENERTVRVRVSKPELAVLEFLDGFGSGNTDVLRVGAERLDRIHGSREKTIKALLDEAALMGRHDLQEKIEKTLTQKELAAMTENFFVFWYNSVIGKLGFDGTRYYWEGRDGWVIPFQHNGRSLPPFLANLREEGMLKRVRNESDIEALRRGGRFLSNISIAAPGSAVAQRQPDIIQERLKDNIADSVHGYVFTGKFDVSLAGLVGSLEEGDSCVGEVARMMEEHNLPTISGAQFKAAVFLKPSGELAAAGIDNNPFSHILKLSPANDRHFGFNEYVCMKASEAAGVTIAEVAMVDLPAFAGQKQTGLLVERYDVADRDHPEQRYFQIDCCAQLGLTPEQKAEGSWETIAELLDKETTDPVSEKEQLFIRAVSSWLIGDSDAHLKNFSILRINKHDGLGQNTSAFTKAVMAPAYDITSSINFVPSPHFCLSLNGKHRDLTKQDFQAFGSYCGLNRTDVQKVMENAAHGCARFIMNIAGRPELAPEQKMFIDRLQGTVVKRMNDLKIELPNVEPVEATLEIATVERIEGISPNDQLAMSPQSNLL
ncbi:serine/threonine-protein kinase HipA [Thalassospira xiamenensis M-5 = DSM 17429]|uniref:HipA domain-containing protein n=1 Tax=Thalassospira xiamenensis TaxID=220697 RepID=UPI000956E8CD|nr:HipA domain-containing protein [Thalassospira xiamenensis]SIT21127.1 serine/threonine-protein kinase HipA [Thalassospira xiamenensis M-5 = DSM 17429]